MADHLLTTADVPVIAQTCLCTNVQRAARAVSRRFDDAFRPLGLTNWQFTLMVALFRPEAPTVKTVARDLATDRTTITAILKPLERRGLVSVTPDGDDRRMRRLALTEAGRMLLEEAYGIWKHVQSSVEADLAIEDMNSFLNNLRVMTAV